MRPSLSMYLSTQYLRGRNIFLHPKYRANPERWFIPDDPRREIHRDHRWHGQPSRRAISSSRGRSLGHVQRSAIGLHSERYSDFGILERQPR